MATPSKSRYTLTAFIAWPLHEFDLSSNAQIDGLLPKNAASLSQHSPQLPNPIGRDGHPEAPRPIRHPFSGIRIMIPAFIQFQRPRSSLEFQPVIKPFSGRAAVQLPIRRYLSRRIGIKNEHSSNLFMATNCHPIHRDDRQRLHFSTVLFIPSQQTAQNWPSYSKAVTRPSRSRPKKPWNWPSLASSGKRATLEQGLICWSAGTPGHSGHSGPESSQVHII